RWSSSWAEGPARVGVRASPVTAWVDRRTRVPANGRTALGHPTRSRAHRWRGSRDRRCSVVVKDLEGAGAQAWTRDDLRRLVAGRAVICTDRASRPRPVPPWLSEAAALVAAGAGDDAGPPDWSRDIHPLDRTKAASAF